MLISTFVCGFSAEALTTIPSYTLLLYLPTHFLMYLLTLSEGYDCRATGAVACRDMLAMGRTSRPLLWHVLRICT